MPLRRAQKRPKPGCLLKILPEMSDRTTKILTGTGTETEITIAAAKTAAMPAR